MPIGKCFGKLHIGSLQFGIVKIIVSVFIKLIGLCPFFDCVQLDGSLEIIKGTERLAGICIILFRSTEKAVPCSKVAVGRARCSGKARKLTLTYVQNMC